MTQRPRVSIIIPVHNRFELARETIESVLQQSYRPLQLILVDDASSPPFELPEIDSELLAGITIQVLRSEENIGPGAAREMGHLKAEGEYLCYLDSDDLWHPQKLEKQIAEFNANPQAGMCYCQSIEFSRLPLSGKEPYRQRSDQEFTAFLPTILYGRPWGTSACMWTKDAVEKIGPWFPGWTFEDVEYDSRAGFQDIQITYLPEVLCYYRKDPEHNQLSAMDYNQVIWGQTLAYLEISSHMRKSKTIQRHDIYHRFISRLRKNSIALFRIGRGDLAIACLKEIYLNAKCSSRKWLIPLLIYRFTGIFNIRRLYPFHVRLVDRFIAR